MRPPANVTSRSRTIAPCSDERARRADVAVGAELVRGREDLLGGHVRDVALAPHGLGRRRSPERALEQADGEVGARAAEPDRVEAALVERRGARGEPRRVLRPGRDRVGLVEAHRPGDGVPEPVDVGLAEDRARPALGRAGDDRPRDAPLGDEPERGLDELRHPRGADAAPVEVGEELGLGVAGDGDARALPARPSPRGASGASAE